MVVIDRKLEFADARLLDDYVKKIGFVLELKGLEGVREWVSNQCFLGLGDLIFDFVDSIEDYTYLEGDLLKLDDNSFYSFLKDNSLEDVERSLKAYRDDRWKEFY